MPAGRQISTPRKKLYMTVFKGSTKRSENTITQMMISDGTTVRASVNKLSGPSLADFNLAYL